MRIVDIVVDRFGVLNDVKLRDLSPGLTVVYGGNGSGKTTLVSFLDGVLHGFTAEHQAWQPDDGRFGGSVVLQTGGRSLRLTRECSHGISSDLSVIDIGTGVAVGTAGLRRAEWITEPVFREIFSVGYQEASQFDLLTRLCLHDRETTVGDPAEISRVESALQSNRHELDVALPQQRSELQARRSRLQAQLEELRRADPEIPQRIERCRSELTLLRDQLRQTEPELSQVQREVRRLEELLENLRQTNMVPLSRDRIEAELTDLNQKRERWAAIRTEIRSQLGGDRAEAGLAQVTDSLKPIRALVSRLEQRIESLLSESETQTSLLAGVNRELFLKHLTSEVYALCDYLSRHESAAASIDASVERFFGQAALQNVERLETSLQGRIDVLRTELSRSADVLETTMSEVPSCESQGHANWARRNHAHGASISSETVLSDLQHQRARQEQLLAQQRSLIEQIEAMERRLAELQSQQTQFARLEDIDRVKARLADVDEQLRQLERRREVLQRTDADLRATLERLRRTRESGVLKLASEYISRLTDGDCFGLIPDANGLQILAETRDAGEARSLKQLSRGTRDLVALALRLALIQCRAQTSERFPLILDDVFVAADNDGANAAADLLLEVAASGQQILFLTSQQDVRDLFDRRDVMVRQIHESPVVPLSVVFDRPPQEHRVVKNVQPVIEAPAQPEAAPVAKSDHTHWLFYLEVDSPVSDLSGLTVAELEAVRAAGLDSVDRLLTLSVDDIEQRLRAAGYAISRDRIRAWRGQASLAVQVPMLRRSDAELLFAAGIESPVELSRLRPETIYERVTAFQNTPAGSRFRRSGRGIDRQQAINWSRWSQHTRSLSEARRSRSLFFVDSRDGSERADRKTRGRRRSARARFAEPRTRRQPRPGSADDTREERQRRKARRRERMQRRLSSYRTSEHEDATEVRNELTFYLNRSDDIEKAPSIGPKTAQRLGAAGIYTVDDLLNADPEEVAEKLANRRITADTIIQWQQQARMICQVPEMRGHDAQILVACGVTEVEQLAGKRPADLFAVVGPFADTPEGERIIRNGRKPDLEEVTDWISWAQHARSLKAAA